MCARLLWSPWRCAQQGLALWPPDFATVGFLGPHSVDSSWLPARSEKWAQLSRCRCCYQSEYSIWQEGAFLLIFLVIIAAALAIGIGARPPKALEILGRHMNKSTQLPVRISVFMLAGLLFLAQKFGFENFTGAFAAGMILGAATRSERGSVLREKMETLSFGWFYPFFFVGAGIQFDLGALGHDLPTMLLVPALAVLFLVIRGIPALLYRGNLDTAQLLPFAFSSAVPSLTIIVVITQTGVRAKSMTPDVAAAMIGAAMLSILLFPTIAGSLLSRAAPTQEKSG